MTAETAALCWPIHIRRNTYGSLFWNTNKMGSYRDSPMRIASSIMMLTQVKCRRTRSLEPCPTTGSSSKRMTKQWITQVLGSPRSKKNLPRVGRRKKETLSRKKILLERLCIHKVQNWKILPRVRPSND